MGNVNIDLETLEEQSKTATPKASTAHTDKHTQTNTRNPQQIRLAADPMGSSMNTAVH